MSFVLRCVIWAIIPGLLCGCKDLAIGSSVQSSMTAKALLAEPVVQTGDRVRITVFGEDRLSGARFVVRLPLTSAT